MSAAVLPEYNNEKRESTGSVEKDDKDLATADVYETDAHKLAEVEDLQEKLANDEADDDAYRVEEAWQVATKVNVGAVLSTKDYPELQAVTFRTIFLGLGFSAFGAVLAQIYYFKPQTLSVSILLLLVLSYWFGNAMHMALPSRGVFRFLNPGPFNIKEHVAIVIMTSTASTSATAIQVISVQALFYDNNMLIGYGYAGLLSDILVKPTKCFWPADIYTANLFQALHYDRQMTSRRVRLFWTTFVIVFCWEIIPEWLFPILTGVSVFCLADNHSATIRNIFGGASNNEGMGLLAVCFDWNYIGSNCMWQPLWFQINSYIGICFTYILMSAVYYGDIWKAKNFPFMSQAIFAEDGSEYNQTALLTNGRFDQEKFSKLGPAYFSATNALGLVTANLSLGALVTHVVIWHWQDLKPFFQSLNPWNKSVFLVYDAHYEKMKAYKQIPRWWYVVVLAGAYSCAQATNYTGNSGLPWWALTVLLIIGFCLCALYATLAATIGFSSNAAGFFEMITAYMVPGNPVANMYGALYGGQPISQGIGFLQDLKLGQYVKLAPRVTFCMQITGTVVGALLNYVMMLSIIENQRPALLSISGTRLWSGQNAQSYNSNAIAWGALAPHMFSPGSTYHIVPLSLVIGLFLPLPFFVAHRLWPKIGFNNFSTPIIMLYSCWLAVGINTQVNTTMAIGIFVQWWVRTRYPRWFTKYNYIVAAGLDGGTQVIMFILNFAIFGASGQSHPFPQWWGNDYNLSTDRCVLPLQ
ncbi:hypothetical protein EVJ58_g2107 [Rhodofomes roseus]|uniref:OPT oligopeptide transporter n=1 Tax=Rhodofomes roseus TaxID=34475 RepID=A0A4Y9YS54_9APHY|nr:hypothetical protein EVJ58_g2107 [Rhodofomes roseus]